MGKDMDRDLVEKITDLIDSCTTLLETITDNVFTYRMIEQPTDQEAAAGETVTFTVKATGVKKYTWQYRTGDSGSTPSSWRDSMFSAATGGDTNSVSFPANSTIASYGYRCKMIDYDNVEHVTNKVNFTLIT